MSAPTALAAAPTMQLPSTCNGADPICHVTVQAIGPTWGGLVGNLAGHVARIVFILVLALIVTRVARVTIRRVVDQVVRKPRQRAEAAYQHPSSQRRSPSTGTATAVGDEGNSATSGDGNVTGSGNEDVPGTVAPISEDRALPDPLRRSQRVTAIGQLMMSTVTVVVWTIATLEILSELGINLAPLLAGAGIAGVAIGFGAQNLVRDVISGVFMLLEDQYGVGDIIDVGTASGTVEQVRLRSTQLRDIYGVVWHIPNGEVKRVGNKSQQWSRAVVDVRVSYLSNVDDALVLLRAVAMEVYREDPVNVIEEPEVLGIEEFGPNGAVLRVLIKTLPAQQWAVQRMMRSKIKLAFDSAGVEIPWLYTPKPVAPTPTPVTEPAAPAGPARPVVQEPRRPTP